MKRREFLSGLTMAGVFSTSSAAFAGSQLSGRDEFTQWIREQTEIELLPGEAQQIQGLLRALRFNADVDPRIEPATRFEPI